MISCNHVLMALQTSVDFPSPWRKFSGCTGNFHSWRVIGASYSCSSAPHAGAWSRRSAHPCHHRLKFRTSSPGAAQSERLAPSCCAVLPLFFITSLEINVVSDTCDDSRNLISRTRRIAGTELSWDCKLPSFYPSHHGTLWIKRIQPFGIQVWASAPSVSPVTLKYL